MSNIPKSKLLDMYLKMQDARNFDNKINRLVRRDFVQGMTHFSIGEEAVSIGSIAALKPSDVILSNHRGHAQCIAKGMDLNKMMAELAGKATGVSRGKGGSMHLADLEHANYGTNGIVGGGMALAAGIALTQKYKKTGDIVVCFTGDGSTNEGNFHESLNLASTWKLPVIYFIINNGYGISMKITKAVNIEHLYIRASAYGIPGHFIENGNDVLAVYEKFSEVVDYVRQGNGPALIEAITYRWLGHSTSDPGIYRSKDEVETWKKKDPLKIFKDHLITNKLASEDELNDLEKRSIDAIEAAVEFAQSSPYPDLSVAYEDVYVN